MNVYPFIAAEKAAAHHVTTACALLEVSQSAYYQWSQHVPSVRERSDGALSEQIVAIHTDSRETYGAPRVHRQLRRNGIVCGRHRVARLMAMRGLTGRAKRRWKRTTITDPSAPPPARDLVRRVFAPASLELDRVWVGDITYLRTWEGWCYLATVIDLASRRVIGFAMADHMRVSLVTDALRMAIIARRPRPGLIFHSDRGSQYTSATSRAARCPWRRAVAQPSPSVLGQRGRGELLRHAQDRARLPFRIADARRGAARDLRVHRSVRQSQTDALHARLLLPGGVRGNDVSTHEDRLGGLSKLSVKPEQAQAGRPR